MNSKNVAIAIIIILVIGGVGYYLTTTVSTTIMALQGEAGVYRNDQPVPFSIWSVNNHQCQDGDALYWKFWLLLNANTDGQLTAVRFKLTQKINGVDNGWIMGTEGVASGSPYTSSTESWFTISLPKDAQTVVPIKYRDLYCGGSGGTEETPTNLLPYTENDPINSSRTIRSARVERLYSDRWGTGTTTWEMHCTIVELTWQYTENGQLQTKKIVPSPNDISFTFAITRTEAGLSVSVVGQGSHP